MSTHAESRSCDAHASQEPTDTAAPARWLSHQVHHPEEANESLKEKGKLWRPLPWHP